jgi:nitrous oxidase accessory protein NosD
MLVWGATAQAAVLDVGAGQPYATVQEALAGAADGDELVLHDEIVREFAVDVDKDVLLRGDPEVTWEGVTVRPRDSGDYAVRVVDGATVRFSGVHFDGRGAGVAIAVSDGAVLVEDSTFTDHAGGGIDVGGGAGDPIGSAIVRGSEFLRNGTGIHVGVGSSLLVVASAFVDGVGSLGNGSAIDAQDGTVEVRRSIFLRNGAEWGPVICDACTIRDSLFLDNAATGYTVQAHASLLLERNRFCGNDAQYSFAGFTAEGPMTLRNNLVVANTSDLYIVEYWGDDLTLEHNTFVGNTTGFSLATGYGAPTPAGNLTLVGNLVMGTSSPEPAFEDYGSAAISASYNAFVGNTGGDASFLLDGTNLVGVAPMLAGAGDACSFERFAPAPGSPLIDGDPLLYDADGTPADIGATGGPSAP